jgi:hypothetical protein
VQGELARAALGGHVPAVAVPMPREVFLELLATFLPDLASDVLLRPPDGKGEIPVAIVDASDQGVLTWAEVDANGLS